MIDATMQKKIEEMDAKQEASRVKGFRTFMDQPLTRAMSSSLALEATKQDAFNLLLSAAYDAGHAGGQAFLIADMIGARMKIERGRHE